MKVIRPFSNGSQYMDWETSNCERCKKGIINELEYRCPIQKALSIAYIGDGQISDIMAKRMGISKETVNTDVWPCGEVEWTEEWKKEYIENNGG